VNMRSSLMHVPLSGSSAAPQQMLRGRLCALSRGVTAARGQRPLSRQRLPELQRRACSLGVSVAQR